MAFDQYHIDRLVEETQKGNAKAFGEIYDLYFLQIHKYVAYRVAHEQVEDMVANVFVKAWTKIKKYHKGSQPFSSWLFRIAHNSVIDHYRTYRQHYELEERIADDHERMNPQHLVEKSLDGERVHRALKKLDSNYQEVILLKYMNELSNKDIAQVLKTSESNVRTLQFRALKKLRTLLEEQDRLVQRRLQELPEQEPRGFWRRIFARSS